MNKANTKAIVESLNSTTFKNIQILIRYYRFLFYNIFKNNQILNVNITKIDNDDIALMIVRPASGHILEAFISTILKKYSDKLCIKHTWNNLDNKFDFNFDHTLLAKSFQDIKHRLKKYYGDDIPEIDLSNMNLIEIKAFKDGKIANPKITDEQFKHLSESFYLLIDYTTNYTNIKIQRVFLVPGTEFNVTSGHRISSANINAPGIDYKIFG